MCRGSDDQFQKTFSREDLSAVATNYLRCVLQLKSPQLQRWNISFVNSPIGILSKCLSPFVTIINKNIHPFFKHRILQIKHVQKLPCKLHYLHASLQLTFILLLYISSEFVKG
jgi:hypothetical protein